MQCVLVTMTMPKTDRRNFVAGALAAGASLAAAPRAFAQARIGNARDSVLADIARRELERAGNAIWRKDIVGISDFGLHSATPRFHLVYLEAGRVESFLVTHGTGSDPEHDGWLKTYSNVSGSEMTSRGAYVTWEWYHGRFGLSMRLGGLDPTNDLAYPRAIVMHPADYATESHVAKWGRLGRSNGCLALGPEQFRHCVRQLAGGRLIFADSFGLLEDGTRIAPPVAQVDYVAPAMPQPTNPQQPDTVEPVPGFTIG